MNHTDRAIESASCPGALRSAGKVAYLTSEYPGISHTFIFREVQALRREGFTVHTASIRRPAHLERMTPQEREDAGRTLYVKDTPIGRIFAAHWRLLNRAPLSHLRMLRKAVFFGLRGPGSLVKGIGYFAEAGVLLDWMHHEARVNHIHVHFGNPAATVAMIAGAFGTVQFSMSVHGPDIFYDVNANLLPEKVTHARMVRCISYFCCSQLMRLVPHTLWSKFHIVRCGVDPDRYGPLPEPARAGGEILCVGRLVPAKGQHVLLEACVHLKDEAIPFHLTFVGDGQDRLSLEQLAHRLGLNDRVTFTGAVGQDQVMNYYDGADIFVLPSFAEGVPVVLMEAMAKEIPCVSTRITGIPELIDDGVDGLLVAPADVEGLAQSMLKLLTDPELKQRIGCNGRRKVLEKYNLDANCRMMANLLSQYLDQVEHHEARDG